MKNDKLMSKTLLDKYADIGITFHLQNGDLKLEAPKGVISTEMLAEFNENKSLLREAIDQKEQLKRILSARLDIEIAYDDDYFKSGGSSTQAISIVNELNKVFDKSYTIIDFYNNSTVNKLYDLLTNVAQSATETAIPVIELLSANHIATKDTIVFFPPLVGIGKLFKQLSNFISRKYNCYAINIPFFDDEISTEGKALFFFDQIQQHIPQDDAHMILVGYDTGVNFAFETAKYFTNQDKLKLVVIDRAIASLEVTITNRFIKKILRLQSNLVEVAKQFSSEEDIFTRATQTLKGLQQYTVSGILKAPIHTFECAENEDHDYMNAWAQHTTQFKGVHYLQGNHNQVLEEDNLFVLANFFNTVISHKK
jgi:surfactin synthase thioesterase subunit